MIIDEAQMDALRQSALRQFAAKLKKYITTECDFSRPYDGSAPIESRHLETQIWELFQHALSYGIDTELGLGQFVVVSLGYSREFYMHPQVNAMLKDARFSANFNMQRVLNAVIVAEARRL